MTNATASRAVVCMLAVCAATASAGQNGTASLKRQTGQEILPPWLPATITDSVRRISLWGASGQTELAGRKLRVAATVRRGRQFLALDANGDGKFVRDEIYLVADKEDLLIELDLPADGQQPAVQTAVLLREIRLQTMNGKVTGISASLLPGNCRQGKILGHRVRLLDSNLDGKITQDGRDAIQIARSSAALPLRTHHAIDGKLVELDLSDDQTGLRWAVRGQVPTGQAQMPKLGDGKIAALVVTNADGHAYDLAVTPQIPAGSYRLVYGIAAGGGKTLPFWAGIECRKMRIAPGQATDVPFGKPGVLFSATVSDGSYTVGPQMWVVGQAGEVYGQNISHVDGGVSPPDLELLAAGKVVEAVSMGYG
jgi:hypothetical protein